MTGLRRAGTTRNVAFLTALYTALVIVYVSLTSNAPSPLPSSLILTVVSSSSAEPLPPGVELAVPIQPPVPSFIYTKDIYEAGHQTPHPEICPALGAHLKLLILITSAPNHVSARNAIRLTWGHFSRKSNLGLAFFLGYPPDALRESLIVEDSFYGDLIIGNNIDSYSNLTLKTISMLEWVSRYCSAVSHMMKTDDDMFINIPQLLNFLQQPSVANASKVIWGLRVKRDKPKREKFYKYYFPPVQFPGRGLPDYCSGPAYLMTGDCILPLLKVAPTERYLRLEDVFITGILARVAGIKRRHEPRFYNTKLNSSCDIQRGISIHNVGYREQFKFWRKLLDIRLACRTPARKRLAIPAPAHLTRLVYVWVQRSKK